MSRLLRSMRRAVATGVLGLGVAGCNLDVVNPNVIDAGAFDPNADGQTLSLSAQTSFFIAFQDVALYGGLISEESWTGAIRLQTNRLASRTFGPADDINADFFAPLSRAVAANANAVAALSAGPGASSDVNLARASMNLGFALELMAETMCSSVIRGGPELSDAQLLDSAIVHFTDAVTVASAAGSAGEEIVQAATVGLARAYLQRGDYANAEQVAARVPASFVANVITSANPSTRDALANQIYATTLIGQLVAPPRYRVGDPRLPVDSTQSGHTLNGVPYVIQAKYTGYADPIRLASGLEAQYIAAEAALHGRAETGPALALIGARRAAGGEGPYGGGTDTASVMAELLNQRARDFWLEGKKLGDLRRNPSVPLSAVLTDPAGAPFYSSAGGSTFGSTLCVPIPPEEANANPNLSIRPR